MSHQPEEKNEIAFDFTIAEAEVAISGDVCHSFV